MRTLLRSEEKKTQCLNGKKEHINSRGDQTRQHFENENLGMAPRKSVQLNFSKKKEIKLQHSGRSRLTVLSTGFKVPLK